jgi:hypothetical protein
MEIPMTEERTEDEGVPAPDEPIEGADELPADVRDGDVSDVEDARLYETNVADGRVSTDSSILEPGTVIVVPVPASTPDESDEAADARRDANAGAQPPVGPGAAVTGQPDDRDDRIAALEEENARLRGERRDESPT